MTSEPKHYVLILSCKDVRGIVAAVSSFLTRHDCFIRESAQFGDPSTGQFFMRCDFEAGAATPAQGELYSRFSSEVAEGFSMNWQLHDLARKPRVLIMVSTASHCLNDLLHRYQAGALPMEIAAVVSNHEVLRGLTEWHGIPFHHMPVNAANKAEQEAKLLALVEELQVDVVVLARYMQILSTELCRALHGKAINIHHSFLPSFKGAKPYHQAYDRGVKIIGATAHYVTSDLDEGPIIEQEIARVDHTYAPEKLVVVGGDVEARVLAHALQYHLEHRVILNGHKTVVFK
ncbi:MAG: formyltetrahydrofolate deformylase [Alphaproteobacteria bacterium]|nr:formyltetrahydrofolate deformylase [Alphaproteobacteria bacterium]